MSFDDYRFYRLAIKGLGHRDQIDFGGISSGIVGSFRDLADNPPVIGYTGSHRCRLPYCALLRLIGLEIYGLPCPKPQYCL